MKVTVRDAAPGASLVTTVDLENDDVRVVQIALWEAIIDMDHPDQVRDHIRKLYNEIYRVTGIRGTE